MLKGAYRKLKSYYYYDTTFILIRKKIAEFESDHNKMDLTFKNMAEVLCHPNSKVSKCYLKQLLNHLDFYVIPKSFEPNLNFTGYPVSNTIQRNKKMKTVNFFINVPIELHIYDTLWTIFAAKMEKDKNILSYDVYGNTINTTALLTKDNKISFNDRRLFNRYFYKYTDWRNNAFNALEKNYNNKNDSILISLDIKSYFYSVAINFKKLSIYFHNHELLKEIKSLTHILLQVYSFYYQKILPFRTDLTHLRNGEYPLPIGLFSSMIFGNIYLEKLDSLIKTHKDILYYGRYVDDILMVFNKTITNSTNQQILDDIFIKTNILKKEKSLYSISKYKSLFIQEDKIKIIYIDHTESRAIIDIYNDNIRVIPSQVDPIPNSSLNLSDFDKVAYSIENFTKENKLRDIGFQGIDSFKVGKFFSELPRKFAHISTTENSTKNEINSQICQIEKFFTGTQSIEFYKNWLNYIYFLVITRQHSHIKNFFKTTKGQISNLKPTSLNRETFKRIASLNKRAKDTLTQHLKICLEIGLSLDIDFTLKYFQRHLDMVNKFINSNMFEHSFIAFPLANYLENSSPCSYLQMDLKQLGSYPKNISQSFKFLWSPRFIHYDELLILKFYSYHNKKCCDNPFLYTEENIISDFCKINNIKYKPFDIKSSIVVNADEYVLDQITIPPHILQPPKKVNIAVGSIDITSEKCLNGCERWRNITLKDKFLLYDILQKSFSCFSFKERGTMLLILPELYFPIYWINDLIRFVKQSQIAIITGLQYLGDNTNQKYNYLATILPFTTEKKKYKNVFVHIREKNDYSPIEFEELAKKGYFCQNRDIARYQTFFWKGTRITPILCFELTDIMARAILKGRSDIIAASVFNPDTTYFSNIIDSATRDLHAFIVQANTSHLGDSRVTGPYDRDSKDIFKIKGGDNDHVVIGTIQFKKLKDFQSSYERNQNKRLHMIERERKKRIPNFPKKQKDIPDIKPLSARFKIKLK